MALTEAHSAAREAAAAVSVVERSPYRGRNRASPGRDFHHPPIPGVLHHHSARVARQAPRRFRGNVHAVLEHGLAGRVGVRQHGRVDVDHDLVALARGAGIDPVVKRRLGEHGQGVRLLLGQRGRFL